MGHGFTRMPRIRAGRAAAPSSPERPAPPRSNRRPRPGSRLFAPVHRGRRRAIPLPYFKSAHGSVPRSAGFCSPLRTSGTGSFGPGVIIHPGATRVKSICASEGAWAGSAGPATRPRPAGSSSKPACGGPAAAQKVSLWKNPGARSFLFL
jgi:hypothetical protein